MKKFRRIRSSNGSLNILTDDYGAWVPNRYGVSHWVPHEGLSVVPDMMNTSTTSIDTETQNGSTDHYHDTYHQEQNP